MLTLELGLIVLLAPLSFSFLGLNALKDQGIAPFKSLISLVYRIILLGIIFSAFNEVVGVAGDKFNDIDWGLLADWGKSLNIFFSTLSAFPVLAYLVYKSDEIASSLAGGSTSMGTADVASAAAMGAAAGAVVASGGAAAAGAASKPAQSMADFMKNMGGGGSVSNASGRGLGGSGGGYVGTPPPPLNSFSGGSGGASSGGEAATKYGSRGQPLNSDPNGPGGWDGTPANSGVGANIGAKNFDQQPASQNQNSGGGGSSFLGNLKDLGKHIEQDKAATHVSINTHHSD